MKVRITRIKTDYTNMKCTKIKMTRIKTDKHEFKITCLSVLIRAISYAHIIKFLFIYLFLKINCGILETLFAKRIHKGKGILLFFNTQ